MTVIEATSGTYSSRVDGTLVLRVEIEPRNRQAALALFGMPGSPMALAALKPATSKPDKTESPVGELCKWAAIRCTEPSFIAWIDSAEPVLWNTFFRGNTNAEEAAAEVVRSLCGVTSRRELDTNEAAAALLHRLIRLPYAAWLKKQQRSTKP